MRVGVAGRCCESRRVLDRVAQPAPVVPPPLHNSDPPARPSGPVDRAAATLQSAGPREPFVALTAQACRSDHQNAESLWRYRDSIDRAYCETHLLGDKVRISSDGDLTPM